MSLSPDLASNTDALDAMLADPEVRQSLAVIVANAPTLAALAAMGTALLQRGPEIADNVNGLVQQLRDEGSGSDGTLRNAISAMAQLAPLANAVGDRADVIASFLDSPILQPEVVAVIGTVGEAATEANARTRGKQAHVGGILALNKVLKDPDVQETLAFLVEFAKVFGQRQRAGK